MNLVSFALVGPRATSAAREAWQCVAELLMSQEIQQRFHDACELADLSPPQLKALLSLESGAAQSMRALADGWRCDASWVTGIVDGLEERGYVQRQAHPTDRRVKVVGLTALGEKAKARALERIYEPPASFIALTPGEQVQLRDLLAKARPEHA
jgi:DNA-binding MarR family transcriptional regulator